MLSSVKKKICLKQFRDLAESTPPAEQRGAALEAGIFGSVKLGRPRLTSPPLRQIHAAQLGDRFLQLMEEAGDMGKPHGQPWVRRATRKVDADEAMVSAVHGGTGCAPAGVATASGNEMTET